MLRKILLAVLVLFLMCQCSLTQRNQSGNKHLVLLERLALEYNPRAIPHTGPDQLPKVYSDLEEAVLSSYDIAPDEAEKYLTLMVLKLYKSHLLCCSQGYEIRREPDSKPIDSLEEPIVYAFLRVLQFDLTKPVEFINSALAYEWVEKNPRLLKYRPIKKEVRIIEEQHRKIKEW